MIALDTNVIIHLMRRHPMVRANFARASAAGAVMVLSAIVVEELNFGIERHRFPDRERAFFQEISARLVTVAFEAEDAAAAGRVRAEMTARGLPPPYADFLIGAHALARDYTLVTANTRDFQNIPGLRLIDWTSPPEPQDPSHG